MTIPQAPFHNRSDTAAPGLSPLHLLLALGVMAVWGSNFVVIKFALNSLPPLLFAALRFSVAAFPLILFLPRPKVGLGNLCAFGLFIGVGQFGLLFLAMRSDITPGLASLIVQTQVFFTIFLSVLFTGERVRLAQIIAVAIAASGLLLICLSAGGSATPLGVSLVLIAAFSWASGNMIVRRAGAVPMLPYMVWSSVFPVPVLFALSFWFEGWPAIASGFTNAGPAVWAAIVWQAVGNTMFGYGVWGYLMARNPAATVAPLALLVPVFGLATAAIALNEPLPLWKLTGAFLIIIGLAIGLIRRPRRKLAAMPS